MQWLAEHDRRLGIARLFPERLGNDPFDRPKHERAIISRLRDENLDEEEPLESIARRYGTIEDPALRERMRSLLDESEGAPVAEQAASRVSAKIWVIANIILPVILPNLFI